MAKHRMRGMKQSVSKSVDEHIAAQSEVLRPKLQQVRAAIRRAVPEAGEGIGIACPDTSCMESRCYISPASRNTILYLPHRGRLPWRFEEVPGGGEVFGSPPPLRRALNTLVSQGGHRRLRLRMSGTDAKTMMIPLYRIHVLNSWVAGELSNRRQRTLAKAHWCLLKIDCENLHFLPVEGSLVSPQQDLPLRLDSSPASGQTKHAKEMCRYSSDGP